MTVSSTTLRADYNGDGVTKLLPVLFPFLANSDLTVFSTTGAVPPISTPLVYGTDYTVVGTGIFSTGAISLTTPTPVGSVTTILRNVALTQETQYEENDPFPAKSHEAALDKLTMIAQQQAEVINRALVLPAPETSTGALPTAASRANKILTFDALGQVTATVAASGSATDLALALLGTVPPVNFMSTLAGSILRSIANKLGDYEVSVNDFPSLQAAIIAVSAAGGGVVRIPRNTTVNITANGIRGASNISIVGEDRFTSILRLVEVPTNHMLSFDNDNYFSLEELTIDFNSELEVPSTSQWSTLEVTLSTNFAILNCRFPHTTKFDLAFDAVQRFVIEGNLFQRDAGISTESAGLLISQAAGQSIFGYVARNEFDKTAMDISCSYSSVVFNLVHDFQFGGGVTTEQDPLCHNLFIHGNVIFGGTGTDVNHTYCNGIENWAPYSILTNNLCYGNAGGGLDQGGYGSVCMGNVCFNNGTLGGSGITARYGVNTVTGVVYSGSGSVYSGNICFDTGGTGGTQSYGFAEESPLLTYIVVGVNQFRGNKLGPVNIQSSTTSYTGPNVTGTAAYTPPVLTTTVGQPAAVAITDVPVVGARIGDLVVVSFNQDLKGAQLTGYVNASNNVKAHFCFPQAGSITIAAGTIVADCRKHKLSADF